MIRLEEAGVPCAPVLTRNQVIEHPQILASEILIESEHPVAGRLRQARNAARFDRTPPEHRRGAPLLAEHTDEVLAEAGFPAEEIAGLRAEAIVGQ